MRINKIIKKILNKWGFDQKNNPSQQVEIPYKQRKIIAAILISIIFLKIFLFVLKILIHNPELEKIYSENILAGVEKHKVSHEPIIIHIISLTFESLFYGVGTYVMLDHKNKLTKNLFKGVFKKTIVLTIIFLITFSLTFYNEYKSYKNLLNNINEVLIQKGSKKQFYLNISFFTMTIISCTFSLISLAAYYAPFQIVIYKNKVLL